MIEWGIILGAGWVTWALCFPVKWMLRRWGFWDQSNERSSHQGTVLRGGGLAPLGVIGLAVFGWVCPEQPRVGIAWLAGMFLLGGISLWDDRRGLAVKWRLMAQFAAAVAVVWALGAGEWSGWTMGWLVFGLVAFINFVNFMDGINGLVSGLLILIVAGLSWMMSDGMLVGVGWVMAGALLGFVPFNFPRAQMFLGDVGSVGIGFAVGVLGLMAGKGMEADANSCWLAVLPMYFFLEGSVAVLRRSWRGEKWWKPHREHFYQRLVRCGWSHARVAYVIWLMQAGVVLWMLKAHDDFSATMGLGLCGLAWGALFLYVERVFERHQSLRA